jgi:hypothetical protein
MAYPSDEEVKALMCDFEKNFGARIPFEDARQMLILYEELCELFERYGGDGSGYDMAALPFSF